MKKPENEEKQCVATRPHIKQSMCLFANEGGFLGLIEGDDTAQFFRVKITRMGERMILRLNWPKDCIAESASQEIDTEQLLCAIRLAIKCAQRKVKSVRALKKWLSETTLEITGCNI